MGLREMNDCKEMSGRTSELSEGGRKGEKEKLFFDSNEKSIIL
jgi:hypothetical protein